jgi:UDP-N-acetylmuramate dehydrogenase
MKFTHAPGIDDSSVRELLARRRESQPIGEWSCGSVFKNPPGDHAARLIDTAGLKGSRIGDASVSLKHANFIINHGAASAADVEQLVLQVQAQVEATHGITLQPEVRIIGDAR